MILIPLKGVAMRAAGNIIASIIISAILVGLGTYFYLNQKMAKQKNDLSGQVDDLKEQVLTLEKNTSQAVEELKTKETTQTPIVDTKTAEVATQTSTDPQKAQTATTAVDTKDWKSFTSTNYNYSIKYPSDWGYSDTTTTGQMNSIGYKPKTSKDPAPFTVAIQKSNLDYTIGQIKKQYATHTYKDKTTTEINGKTFTVLNFTAKDGKTNLSVDLFAKDDLVYYFSPDSSTDTNTNAIMAEMAKSFTFTK